MLTDVLGIPVVHTEDGMAAFDLPDGSGIETFTEDYPGKEHFDTGPVIGFWVEDLAAATAELVGADIELLGVPGPSWQHFRGPDGSVYELKLRAATTPVGAPSATGRTS